MPNYTKNYNLKKPLQEEFYNIDDHNGNMDIIDEVLKNLSEESGVIISPDEPETGDVWIDTDDESGGSGGSGAVSSVNGQTGEVVLTPEDIGAVSSINGKTGKVVISAEDVGASASEHKHSASDITAGTFGGKVVASYQAANNYLVRNQKLSSSAEETDMGEGEICWQYE